MAELGSCFNRHAKRGEHDNVTRNLIDICNPKFRNKVQDLDKPGTSGRKKQPLPPFLPDSIGLNRPTSPQYLLTEGSQKTYTHTHRSNQFLIYDFQHTSKRVCKTENSQSTQTFTHQSREEMIIIIEEANRQRKQPKRKKTNNKPQNTKHHWHSKETIPSPPQ